MSGEPSLTPVQQAAGVDRLADNIALCSGAGCGKTLVLARRFAELLRSRPEVEDPLPNFVALTFTEKAAVEMSQRVRRTLLEFAGDASPSLRSRCRRWLEALPEARISTIHGFCASLLRSWAVEAGLDPSFAVAAENDLVIRRLSAESAEEVVLDALENGDPAVADLIERNQLGPLTGHVHALASMRTECDLEDYKDPRRTLANWTRAVEQTRRSLWFAACRDGELDRMANELAAIPCRDQGDLIAAARERLLSALGAALKSPEPPSAGAFAAALGISLQGGRAGAWGGKEPLAQAKALLGELRERLKPLALCGESMGEADRRAAEDLGALARLAEKTRRRYDAAKRSRGLVDFTDLLERAGRLLAQPAVAQAVAGQVHQLLLDEAQDTDAFQISMIERLLFGDAGAPLPPGRLFLVGDPKQSIYRFRGARVEAFESLCRRLGEHSRLWLDRSFRSHRGLVAFVNHLFAGLMGGEYARIEAHRDESPPGPCVEVLLAAGATDSPLKNAACAGRAQAALAAQRIREMVENGERIVREGNDWRAARYGDVAILFSRMTDSLQYERELALRGVPYYVVAGTGFFQQQEVLDLLSALAAIDNPYDDVSLIGALRSSLFGLDDNAMARLALSLEPPYFEKLSGTALESAPALLAGMDAGPRGALRDAVEVLRALARRKDAVPIDSTIAELLDATGYEAVLLCQPQGRRKVANVRRLMELARPGAAGPLSLAEFIAEMRQRIIDQSRHEQAAVVTETDDVVRLMTIHKAKGLEFPVVILPDLSAGRETRWPALLHRPDTGLVCRSAQPANGTADPDEGGANGGDESAAPLAYRVACALEAEDLRKEDIRRLYVAATRAMDHLTLIGADWRDKVGRLKEPLSHMRLLDHHLGIDRCLQADGRLEYHDAGRTYYGVVRGIVPSPPSRRAGARSEGRRMLDAARSPAALADAILSTATAAPAPPLLGPPPETARLELGVAAMSDFGHCPMLYRWRHELRVPPRRASAAPAASGAAPAVQPAGGLEGAELGTFLHRCMELLDFNRPQPADALVRLASADMENAGDIDVSELARSFQPMLESFLRHPLGKRVAAAKKRMTELAFVLDEGPLRLSGKIDLLWQGEDSLWHIVDYKSDRASGADLAEYASLYELQMAAYALAASRGLGGAKGAASRLADADLYFLRLGKVHSLPAASDTASARRLLSEAASRFLDARRKGEYPPCRDPACAHCDYSDYCAAMREKADP
jgi:ATP-dependent helicase/nuclease subunit A